MHMMMGCCGGLRQVHQYMPGPAHPLPSMAHAHAPAYAPQPRQPQNKRKTSREGSWDDSPPRGKKGRRPGAKVRACALARSGATAGRTGGGNMCGVLCMRAHRPLQPLPVRYGKDKGSGAMLCLTSGERNRLGPEFPSCRNPVSPTTGSWTHTACS